MNSPVHPTRKTNTKNVKQAAARLSSEFPSQVFPGNSGIFWDLKQSSLSPVLRIEPSSSAEVSSILQILIEENCHFAIKSGGSARGEGSSNAESGVTIDLIRLQNVEIAEDRNSVKIGAGATWLDVYSKLDPYRLTVAGGRVSMVGVGGFLLGGGLSFFCQRRGWSCDGIISYKIVLPSGEIANVDRYSDRELFWALRGAGSSNFGIVTSFVMEAIDLPNFNGAWTRTSVYTRDKLPQVLNHLQDLWITQDQDLSHVSFYSYNGSQNSFNILESSLHTTHSDPDTWPKSLSPFESIERVSSISKVEIVPLAKATVKGGKGMTAGRRNIWLTFTYRPTREFTTILYTIFEEEVIKLKDVKGFRSTLGVQLVPRNTTHAHKEIERVESFLPLSFEHNEGPLIIANFSCSYVLASDAQTVEEATVKCIEKMEAKAKELRVWHPFRYMNYADEKAQASQVWDGYGERMVTQLRKIQKSIDPTEVFTRGGLASGYFKLNSCKGPNL